jgi:hypothetical protein
MAVCHEEELIHLQARRTTGQTCEASKTQTGMAAVDYA